MTTDLQSGVRHPAVLAGDDQARLDEIRGATMGVLRDVIGERVPVAVIDVPNQRNTGDSLILAGEVAYFRRLGLDVRYVSDLHGYDGRLLRRMMPNGVVLLHGGGNLGDLWPGHQRHREQVVADLTEYRVVQLPQSIYFQSEERARAADEVLSAHPDFLVLVRDSLSLGRAAKHLPGVTARFCHDMAFGWSPPVRRKPSVDDETLLVLARSDVEAASGLDTIPADWVPGIAMRKVDWHHTGAIARRWGVLRRVTRAYHHVVRLGRRLPTLAIPPLNRVQWRVLLELNRLNIAAGLHIYRDVSIAVVDRLHAHVLAVLLGIDHVLLDNNYAKLRGIYDDSTGGFTTAHYSRDLSEAREHLIALRER